VQRTATVKGAQTSYTGGVHQRLEFIQISFIEEQTSMTGYTVHTGSTEAFAENYDQIFGAGTTPKKKKAGKKKTAKAASKKKRASPKKKAKKK